MDKKSSSSSSESRFHIGKYDADAWRRDNYGKGGGPDIHKGHSRFDKCYNYPYTGMSDTKAESAQSSRQKDQ
ncbi:MAG: hypothetical protein ACR5K9_07975 [Wolbachia sp.]